MSPRRDDRAGELGRDQSTFSRWAAGVLYTVVCVVLATIAAHPIYDTPAFFLLVAVSAIVAAMLVGLVVWRGWSGWALAGGLAIVFAVVAVPLAVPSRLTSPLDVVRGVGEALAGVIVGWKDLVTVDLPVGSYRNLLVPALLVFLVGTASTLRLAVRTDRRASAAVITGLAMPGFGLIFGRSATSAPVVLGALEVPAPTETVVGLGAFLSAVLWLAWRAHDARSRAVHTAAEASTAATPRTAARGRRIRAALAAAMIVSAGSAAAAVVPAVAEDADRQVLRSAAGPERRVAEAVSPLSEYRSLFSDARAGEVLFRVSADGALPERIRIATLDTYDGEVFRASGREGRRFVRLPSARDAGPGAAVAADLEIEGLTGIWMPTTGRLASVSFDGPRRSLLADGFYYSADAEAGVQIAENGLAQGDRYRLTAVEPATTDVARMTAPGFTGGVTGGDNLRRWVQEHATGSDGAALQALVSLLRERGYLSHGLAASGSAPPTWAADLPGYRLQPSASGHSLARIDRLFERLLERENDPRAAATGNYVAAVGDDEQFAVATALMARELGFPSRVVVGTRLMSGDTRLPTCAEGECRAQDVSAWTEIRGQDGRWGAVDVTPQWENSPSLEVSQQQDPENVTEVLPDTVEEVVPPEPAQQDAPDDDQRVPDAVDLAALWAVVRIASIVVLVLLMLCGPFLAVVVAKVLRRRGRRLDPDPRSSIAGGWEEYVDAGVDAGRPVPPAPTRREVATAFATPAGTLLADQADRAVFSASMVGDDDVAAFWRIVDAERRVLTRERGSWRRLRAAVSLRSFLRLLAPRRFRRGAPDRHERRGRPATSVGRDST